MSEALPRRECSCVEKIASSVHLTLYFYTLMGWIGNNQLNFQEKRYRSMQEHIRRAHPEHYIAKLPATEESFQLMISTPPSDRPQPTQNQPVGSSGTFRTKK